MLARLRGLKSAVVVGVVRARLVSLCIHCTTLAPLNCIRTTEVSCCVVCYLLRRRLVRPRDCQILWRRGGLPLVRPPEVDGMHGRARFIACSASVISCWLCGLLRRVVRRLGSHIVKHQKRVQRRPVASFALKSILLLLKEKRTTIRLTRGSEGLKKQIDAPWSSP